jgi:hypothetical protein
MPLYYCHQFIKRFLIFEDARSGAPESDASLENIRLETYFPMQKDLAYCDKA